MRSDNPARGLQHSIGIGAEAAIEQKNATQNPLASGQSCNSHYLSCGVPSPDHYSVLFVYVSGDYVRVSNGSSLPSVLGRFPHTEEDLFEETLGLNYAHIAIFSRSIGLAL